MFPPSTIYMLHTSSEKYKSFLLRHALYSTTTKYGTSEQVGQKQIVAINRFFSSLFCVYVLLCSPAYSNFLVTCKKEIVLIVLLCIVQFGLLDCVVKTILDCVKNILDSVEKSILDCAL